MTERECHVFLVGEGPTDIGEHATLLGPSAPKKGKRAPDRGFIAPVLRRIAAEHGITLRFSGQKVASLPKRPSVPARPEDTLAMKARTAMALAKLQGANVLVMLHDVDREPGVKRDAREAKARHASLCTAMLDGASSARGASEQSPALLVGAPLRMIEAWVLGDASAVAGVAERGAQVPSKSPEHLWGDKHNPSSDYPKHVLSRSLGKTEASSDVLPQLERDFLKAG